VGVRPRRAQFFAEPRCTHGCSTTSHFNHSRSCWTASRNAGDRLHNTFQRRSLRGQRLRHSIWGQAAILAWSVGIARCYRFLLSRAPHRGAGCVFLQIGALIPLGIFAATIVSRLRFLGIDAAGPNIALFGGFTTVFNGVAAGFTVWAMIHPGVTQDVTLTAALYHLSYAFGGPGFPFRWAC
jgi:hypothetical protein